MNTRYAAIQSIAVTSQRHARVFPDPHALEPHARVVRVDTPE